MLEELTFEGGMAWASRFDEKVAQEIVRHAERELDAAAEIYICRQFSRLRDSYLLKTVPEGLVSSQRLNVQLQDRPTKTGVKPGVLSLYAARCPTHFSAGRTWNASEWVLAASPFVGIKMLERQRKHGALITDFADRMLAATERVRELMQSTAAMIGRIAGGTQAAQDLQRVVQECFRVEYERFLDALDSMSTEEYRL